jgi:hypothetical protein
MNLEIQEVGKAHLFRKRELEGRKRATARFTHKGAQPHCNGTQLRVRLTLFTIFSLLLRPYSPLILPHSVICSDDMNSLISWIFKIDVKVSVVRKA